MKYFLLKLNPPRPTFMLDQNAAEQKVMQEHFAYWAGLSDRGTAVTYGPVADPAGGWGLAIIAVADDSEAATIDVHDPAIKSGLGFRYERFPMPQLLVTQRSMQP